jgi:hypothetical protein
MTPQQIAQAQKLSRHRGHALSPESVLVVAFFPLAAINRGDFLTEGRTPLRYWFYP